MTTEIKYRHPFNHDLTWAGKGKAPKWYDHALENGLTEEALRVESQSVVVSGEPDIDLGISSGPVINSGAREALSDVELDLPVAAEKSNTKLVSDLEISGAELALAEYLEVDLAAAPEVLLSRVRDNSRSLLIEEIRMGLRLIALKGRLEHGEFLPAIGEIGVAEHTAQGAMRTARAFAAEGNARLRQQLLDMGKTKGAALLAAKPEVREQILNDPELAQEAQEASKMELLRLLKDKEEQIERSQEAYSNLETQLEIRSLELKKLSRVDPASLLTRSVRAEAVANAAAIGELCDNLIRLADAVMDESIAAEQRELRERAIGAAVGAAMAHLQALYTALEGHLEVFPKLTALDDLTQDEISQAVKCRTFVEVQFGQRLAQRRDEAYAEHLADGGAKRRGRPPKKAEVR